MNRREYLIVGLLVVILLQLFQVMIFVFRYQETNEKYVRNISKSAHTNFRGRKSTMMFIDFDISNKSVDSLQNQTVEMQASTVPCLDLERYLHQTNSQDSEVFEMWFGLRCFANLKLYYEQW